MFRLNTFLVILTSVLLTACGGGGGPVVPDSGTDGGGGTPVNPSSVTYFPMNFLLSGEGYTDSEIFAGIMFDPLVKAYVIAPVNAQTLEPATATISDFNITVNGQSINRFEQYAMLQRIIGLPIQLSTAVIIDASGTARSQVNKTSLINAVNDYFDAVSSNTNSIIRNQNFTVWIYGDVVETPVASFANAAAAKTAAATAINTRWDQLGDGSSTYEAIVKAVGTYVGNSPTDSNQEYDMIADGIADLFDGFVFSDIGHALNRLNLSNVVLIGAGGMPSNNVFNAESVTTALNWQSLIVYDTDAESEGGSEEGEGESGAIANSPVTNLGKPLFFIHVGGNTADTAVTSLASVTINASDYDFAAELIAAQRNSISIRSRDDNQHLVRFAVRERDGSHTLLFSSRTNGFNYGLTTELDSDDISAEGDLDARVEITTARNEFLAAGRVSVADVTRLYPATRYTVTSYEAGDYSWTVNGVARAANSDGSIAISAADAGQTVVLTNNTLSSGVTSTSLTITN